MKRACSIALAAAALTTVLASAAAAPDPQATPSAERPVRLAEEDTFEARKQAYLLDTEREVVRLVSAAERLVEIMPSGADANDEATEALRVFNDKVSALEAKLDALRATPGDHAQAAMDDAQVALADVRAAYSRVVDAAK